MLNDNGAHIQTHFSPAPHPEPSPPASDLADDDFFGSEPASPRPGNTEWSDIPRLREKHETEGYRDGVTQGKSTSVQAGFDEGYGLGAVLGLRVGRVLGLLEGVWAAVGGERLEGIVKAAREELRTERVFGREYFGEDGVWGYEVEGEEGMEVVFGDVAGGHPLVRKWEGVVAEEVRRWGLDLEIMENNDQEKDKEDTGKAAAAAAAAKENTQQSAAPRSRKELSW